MDSSAELRNRRAMKNNAITCHISRTPGTKEKQLFDAFITDCDSQSFMQTSDWLDVYTPTRLQSFLFVWCTDESDRILAGGLARLTKIGGRYLASFQRGPVAHDISALDVCIPVISARLKEEGVFSLMMNPHWEGETAREISAMLGRHGFSVVPLKYRTSNSVTATVNLEPEEEEIFAGFRGRCRRNIRTAMKKGVVIREAVDAADALAIERVQERMAEVKHMDTAGIPDIGRLLEILRREKRGIMLVAELNGEILGSVGIVHEGTRSYMQIAVISPDHPQIPLSSILYWESMKIMKKQGCRAYDLVGFPEGGIENTRDDAEKGRAHFKLEFNPAIVNLVPLHVKALRPLSHLLLFNARQYYLQSSIRRHLAPFLKGEVKGERKGKAA